MIRNFYICLLCLMLLLLAACSEEAVSEGEEDTLIIPVEVEQVEVGTLTDNIAINGHIVAKNHLPVIPLLNGEVLKIHVENGDMVSRGDLLLELDPADISLNVDQARAGLRAAEANLQHARDMRNGAIKQAELQVKQARQAYDLIKEAELAEAESANQETELPLDEIPEELLLLVQGLLGGAAMGSGMDLEQAKMSKDAAELGLEQAKSSSGIEAAEASVEQAKIALRMAEQQVENVQIRAPLSGQVVGLNAIEGALVSPQAPLMQIVELDSLHVRATINENQLSLVEMNKEVELHIRALQQSLTGYVAYISPLPAEQSRSYPIEIAIDELHEQLKVGLTTEIILELTDDLEQILIPFTALSQYQGQDVVYVVTDDEIIERRAITIIGESAQWLAIESGVVEGENIVTRGLHQLTDGARVSVQNGGE